MPESADSEVLENSVLDPSQTMSEFDELMEQMVAVSMPRLFAIVREFGGAIDVRIAAWGMAFVDRVEIMTIEGDSLRLPNPETAVAWFGRGRDVTAHLVWADSTSSTMAAQMRWCPWHGPFSSYQDRCPMCPIRLSSLGTEP